ncbi:MAG TPA: hypothetical protein VHN15_13460 [Thermoanaerobaculia bacterium]|nr:hypothetical protein [Thermoanaerobaculia bacterium]
MLQKRSLGSRWAAVVVFLAMGATLHLVSPARASAERYVQATVDEQGQLTILTEDGRSIVTAKDHEQVAFSNPQVSPDGSSVGWLAEYPFCCTSYPIPLKLVIYSKDATRTFTGSGLPIWDWQFRADGKQVAFRQETVHGGAGVHYEWRDVVSDRLLAEWEPEVGIDNRPLPAANLPEWVRDLGSQAASATESDR